jgi:hypothetical protein
MGSLKLDRLIAGIGLILIMIMAPVVGTSCSGKIATGEIANALAATMVPDVDLDVYFYFNQGSPTNIPKNLVKASQDMAVDSFSLWGVIENENIYAVGGAFVFTNAADAGSIYSQISAQTDDWTRLADKTIYVVRGAGGPAEKLENAISKNNFKRYNDQKALAELSRMPYTDSARPAAVGIIKPTKAAVDLVKSQIGSNAASTLDSAFNWGKPQIIVCGLYSAQKLEIADITQKISNGSIREMNLGAMMLVDSSVPGAVFSPIANHLLETNGLAKTSVGNLSVYQTSVSSPVGGSIPVMINIDGNQVFVTASLQPTFARDLLTGIKQ